MEPSVWVGFFFPVITLLQLVIWGENIAVQVKNKTFRDANMCYIHVSARKPAGRDCA